VVVGGFLIALSGTLLWCFTCKGKASTRGHESRTSTHPEKVSNRRSSEFWVENPDPNHQKIVVWD
jgi:hypothetical protein